MSGVGGRRQWRALGAGAVAVCACALVAGSGSAKTAQNPFVAQDEKRFPSDESAGGSYFGFSVALSADGTTALVGGPSDDLFRGAAWIFVRSGTRWVQQGGKLIPRDEAGAGQFGSTVALSADGTVALIGGPTADNDAGAAWTFTRSRTGWSQQGSKLTGSGQSGNAQFGSSVALSADGSAALIGGPKDDENRGAVWAFARVGSTWAQQGGKLTGQDDNASGSFGWSIALSADGVTALIGAPADNADRGVVWPFVRTGSSWTPRGRPLGVNDAFAGADFGWSVALSADGATALIGGISDDAGTGAAWIFKRVGSEWSQYGRKLTPNDIATAAPQFGASVALSANGAIALIGGPNDNDDAGAAWVIGPSGDSWTQLGAKLTGIGQTENAGFGYSTAISASGGVALIGGPTDDAGIGAVWGFTNPSIPAPIVRRNATLTVKKTGKGSVKSTPPGILCGSRCRSTFPIGANVTLAAVKPPSSVVRWRGCTPVRLSCRLRLQKAVTVTVTFAALKRK
jgi:hypothetical protein